MTRTKDEITQHWAVHDEEDDYAIGMLTDMGESYEWELVDHVSLTFAVSMRDHEVESCPCDKVTIDNVVGRAQILCIQDLGVTVGVGDILMSWERGRQEVVEGVITEKTT
jgi:hypothetical protein